MKNRRREKGQAMVEYIIIIVIVAVAALTIMGVFSDRIRQLISGAASSFGADNAADTYNESNAIDILRNMDESGLGDE